MLPAPAFAASSDEGLIFWGGLAALGVAYWFYSSAVRNGVEKALIQRKAAMEAAEKHERRLTTENAQKERAQTAAHTASEREQTAAHAAALAAQIKKAQDEERAQTAAHAASEREQTAAHAAALAAQIKKAQDDLEYAQLAFDEGYIQGRAWLAEYIAEAFRAPDDARALALKVKKNAAHKAAAEVKAIAAEKQELLKRVKQLEYTLKTYHEYYPVLEQYAEDILNEEASLLLADDDPDTDRVSHYISHEEYQKLSAVERNQRALDNWKTRRKSSVEIGRMYERYLGYLYEKDGWNVAYIGATQGLEDMGRDLLCSKSAALHVVQAKYWSKHKTIHEKHVFQLYGTTVLLPLTNPDLKNMRLTPVFAATTVLSETAAWAAKQLGVMVKQHDMDPDYPMIKCNVNGRNKIYHLPFDQQYDRVRIDPTRAECYVKTTAEAERLGFRRAMRHAAYAA